VPKNEALSVDWYQKAALQGHVSAQYLLGLCYLHGQGIPKNWPEAYKWALLAGAKEPRFRESIPRIERLLTPNERAEGQRLAKEFKPTSP
jgi:hypothetical protein